MPCCICFLQISSLSYDDEPSLRLKVEMTSQLMPCYLYFLQISSPFDDDERSRLVRVASQCSSARFQRTPSRGRTEGQELFVGEDHVLITQWSDDDVTSGAQSSDDEYDLSSQSDSCSFEPGDIDREDAYDTDLEVDDESNDNINRLL